jgi:lipopolysaccharide/colanic/teichoic acid biosynthesis glycosyltransferase
MRKVDYTTPIRPRQIDLDPAKFGDRSSEIQFNHAAKRAADVIIAALGLILLSPIFLLASIAIKLESGGSILRRQEFYALNKSRISVLKFRCTTFNPAAKTRSSTTRVGALLSRTGIEGLPRLLNVLRGDMSIVGPHLYAADSIFLIDEHTVLAAQRSRLKPGLTGWAQVHGFWNQPEGRAVIRHQIPYDRFYIQSACFRLDMKIILMTLVSKNSYS